MHQVVQLHDPPSYEQIHLVTYPIVDICERAPCRPCLRAHSTVVISELGFRFHELAVEFDNICVLLAR